EAGGVSRGCIYIPYLKSYQAHKQFITAYLLSDQGVGIALHDRVGKGWSANFFSPYNLKREYLSRKIALLSMSFSFFMLYVLLIQRASYQITLNHNNLGVSTLLSQPEMTVILFLAVFFLAFRSFIDQFIANAIEMISSIYSGIQPRSRFKR